MLLMMLLLGLLLVSVIRNLVKQVHWNFFFFLFFWVFCIDWIVSATNWCEIAHIYEVNDVHRCLLLLLDYHSSFFLLDLWLTISVKHLLALIIELLVVNGLLAMIHFLVHTMSYTFWRFHWSLSMLIFMFAFLIFFLLLHQDFFQNILHFRVLSVKCG